jgi:hypothetical protein
MLTKLFAVSSALICVFVLAGPGLADNVPVGLTIVGSDTWDSNSAYNRLLAAGEPFSGPPITFSLDKYNGAQSLARVELHVRLVVRPGVSAFENQGSLLTLASAGASASVSAAVNCQRTFDVARVDFTLEAPVPFSFSDSQSTTTDLAVFQLHGDQTWPTTVAEAKVYFDDLDSVMANVNGGNYSRDEVFTFGTYDLSSFTGSGTLPFEFFSTGSTIHSASLTGKAFGRVPRYSIEAEVVYFAPEPLSMGMLALGSLVLLRRRRK